MTSSRSGPEMGDFLPYLLFQAGELTSRNFQEHYRARYGMLRTEWRVLFHLGRAGDQTAKQIGQAAALHKTKVSRAVKALEAKRFLSREVVRNDRRSEILSLTKQGHAAFADLSRVASDYDKMFEHRLGETAHADLVASLQNLIKMNEMHDEIPDP